MSIGLYDSSLNGPQMDTALEDMANHTSERYAKGTVNGVPVSSGMGYHDNAKYYADQAASVIPGEYTDAVRFDIDQTNIKSAAEKAQARANIACGSSNRNLLDNGWFTINQRGVTSAPSSSGISYFVDRWKYQYTSYNINSDKSITITVTSPSYGIYQIIEGTELVGKQVTFSYMDGNSAITSMTFVMPNSHSYIGEGDWKIYVNIYSDKIAFWFIATSSTVGVPLTLKAVKLELGSVSTLANDTAPDTATELAKCQRYCYVMSSYGTASTGNAFSSLYGIPYSNSGVAFLCQFPVTMRTYPAISANGEYRLYDVNANTSVDISSSQITRISSGGTQYGMGIYIPSTPTAGHNYLLYSKQNVYCSIILSADL